MFISNIIISNYRNFKNIDIKLAKNITTIENNNGKSNLLKAAILPFLADKIVYAGKNLTWFDINGCTIVKKVDI